MAPTGRFGTTSDLLCVPGPHRPGKTVVGRKLPAVQRAPSDNRQTAKMSREPAQSPTDALSIPTASNPYLSMAERAFRSPVFPPPTNSLTSAGRF